LVVGVGGLSYEEAATLREVPRGSAKIFFSFDLVENSGEICSKTISGIPSRKFCIRVPAKGCGGYVSQTDFAPHSIVAN